MLAQAERALNELPSHERDISSLTLCLSSTGFARVKDAIARFRRVLLQLSELEERPVQVMQVNFQLFPLSRHTDVGGDK